MTMTQTRSSGTTRACCCCKNWCPECTLPVCRPPQESTWAAGTLNTEYKDKYVEKDAVRGGKTELPGKQYVDSLAHLNGLTTQRADYTPKGANHQRSKQKASGMPKVPFDGTTTYNTFHDEKGLAPSTPTKKPVEPLNAPFYGVTSNRADYAPHAVKPRVDHTPKYQLSSVPFDGQSTYAADFDKKQPLPRDPRAKAPLLQSSTLENPSTYAVDFVPKPFNKKTIKICCSERKHTGTYMQTTTCHDRPGTTCSSCNGH